MNKKHPAVISAATAIMLGLVLTMFFSQISKDKQIQGTGLKPGSISSHETSKQLLTDESKGRSQVKPTGVNHNISKETDDLFRYPMNEKSDYQEIKDRGAVQKTAEAFFMTCYNVDFRNLEGYRQKMLYYFSASSNGDEWVDIRISDIQKNKIVSRCKFITDPTLIYIDKNLDIRVRGRLLILYEKETDKTYLQKMSLKSGIWYYRDLEVILTLAVDNGMWERGDWTYLGCNYLSRYKKYQEG